MQLEGEAQEKPNLEFCTKSKCGTVERIGASPDLGPGVERLLLVYHWVESCTSPVACVAGGSGADCPQSSAAQESAAQGLAEPNGSERERRRTRDGA